MTPHAIGCSFSLQFYNITIEFIITLEGIEKIKPEKKK